MNNKYIVILMSAGLILPASAAETVKGSDDKCWSEVAQYDSNGDGVLGENEFSENADAIFAALDGDENGELSREEFEGCFLGHDQPRTAQRFDDIDLDRNGVIVVAELTGEKKAKASAEGAEITVDQAQPTVTVEQAQPTVTVEQAQPTVTVEQAQPTVTVEQAQPTVTVEQGQPTVTVEQGQPTVSVEQAEPKVMVEQAEPKVSVEQAEPKVSVEQDEPKVSEVQDEQKKSADTENTKASFDLASYSADQLMGMEIENLQGNDIGDIEDVVADANNEVFFIIDVGGFLGIGSRSVAVPAKDFQVVEDKLVLQTAQSEDDLEQLPEYEETQYEKYNW